MEEYAAVVIPACINSEARMNYLYQTLESVSQQTFPTIALIVDDSSTFDVQKLVTDCNCNDRLRYVHRQKLDSDSGSSSEAVNLGLDLVLDKSQDIFSNNEKDNIVGVCYLHSDDMLPADSVEARVNELDKSGFVYGLENQIDGEGNFKCIKSIPYLRIDAEGFPHHTGMWSFDMLSALRDYAMDKYGQEGVFDNCLSACEDRDVSISTYKLLKKLGKKPIMVPSLTYIYREHDDSISGNLTKKANKDAKRRVKMKHKVYMSPQYYLPDEIIRENIMREKIISRISADLPWSLFTFLPEPFKVRLRGVRDKIKDTIALSHQTSD